MLSQHGDTRVPSLPPSQSLPLDIHTCRSVSFILCNLRHSKIPSGDSPDLFKIWLDRQRFLCDKCIADNVVHPFDGDRDAIYHLDINNAPPCLTGNIQWVWTLDLDNLLFLIDNTPVFRLDHLPPADVIDSYIWCDYQYGLISRDRYGHISCTPETPPQSRFDSKPLSLPPVNRSLVHAYHASRHVLLPIHQLLQVEQALNNEELVHLSILEVSVGHLMGSDISGRMLRMLKTKSDVDSISGYCFDLAVSMLNIPAMPIIYLNPIRSQVVEMMTHSWTARLGYISLPRTFPVHSDETETPIDKFAWIRTDICAYITPHLDDEPHMQAAIVQLVDRVKIRRDPSTVIYGIVFSLFHCVVIRVGVDGSVVHTPVMPFLPSFRALSPSTDGMVALTRLCHLPDPDFLLNTKHMQLCNASSTRRDEVAANLQYTIPTVPPGHLVERIPRDVWLAIAEYLHSPDNILNLSLAETRTADVATRILRRPRINEYTLIELVGDRDENGKVLVFDGETLSKNQRTTLTLLTSAAFSVVDVAGQTSTLFLGPFSSVRDIEKEFDIPLLVQPATSSQGENLNVLIVRFECE